MPQVTAVSTDGAPPTGDGGGVVVHRTGRRVQVVLGGRHAQRVPDRPTSLHAVSALAATQDGVLTTRQVEEAGVSEALLRTLVRSEAWVPLVRGTYLVEPERTERERRRSWARAGTLLVPGSAVSHHTAAALLGIHGAPRAGVVHVSRAAKALARPQLHPHRAAFGPDDVVDLDGLSVTSPGRTLTDLVPQLDRLQAQAVLDSALHTGSVSRSELQRAGAAAQRRAGHPVAADVWADAAPEPESPLESRVRRRCLDGGVRPSGLQHPVVDRWGRTVATADLAFDWRQLSQALGLPVPVRVDVDRPLLGEADGRRFHGEGDGDEDEDAFVWDRRRQNLVQGLGFVVVRFTWADTVSRGAVLAGLRTQLQEAVAA